jgi:hypothetical protein
MRPQGQAEIAREQGITAYDAKIWSSSHQIAINQLNPLPEPARRGLVNITNDGHISVVSQRLLSAR